MTDLIRENISACDQSLGFQICQGFVWIVVDIKPLIFEDEPLIFEDGHWYFIYLAFRN